MAESNIPNLKRLRNERRLTQAQLGAALGIAGRTILRWENGDGEPGASELLTLARFFEVSIDQLLSELMKEDASKPIIRASDLSGPDLDCWAAKVLGLPAEVIEGEAVYYEPGFGQRPVPRYSLHWEHGGALIELKKIHLLPIAEGSRFDEKTLARGGWVARCAEHAQATFGETALVAATRAFVASGLGRNLFG